MIANRNKKRVCAKKYCTANKNGLCVALNDTRMKRDCPFFRDVRTMSEEEISEYEKFAMRMQ